MRVELWLQNLCSCSCVLPSGFYNCTNLGKKDGALKCMYNINSYPMFPTKMTAHPQKGSQTYPHDIVPFPVIENFLSLVFFSDGRGWGEDAAEVKKAIVKNMENSSITFEEAKKRTWLWFLLVKCPTCPLMIVRFCYFLMVKPPLKNKSIGTIDLPSWSECSTIDWCNFRAF